MNDIGEESSPVKSYFLEPEQDAGQEDSDPGPLGNPIPPPDVDLDKLRGDRIGDTVYSGKWCIQIVMKLMQSNVVMKAGVTEDTEDKADLVDMEEELQNEVGALWDMTSNVEVCQYLHSIGAIESICYVITNSRCPRATEMCVGMLANIITHNELWDILCGNSSIFTILIQLLTNTDQPALLEVTRFFNTALCHRDNTQCYTCLCENGPLVTQELMRILSGSTNGDLLKQAAELAYNVMSLDDTDSHFCAFFADGDFVLAIVEASKEVGFEHETSGQNYIMEVFHYFTTYQAGILAIENCMEQIAETNTAYLKFLCKSLNLSNSSTIITTILSTLNHIFCRQVVVRLGLMSSPSFIHCVLKTLVAVYRKLGSYSSIAYPKSKGTTHAATASSSWKTEEDTPTHTRPSDTASWSERASVAVSSSSTFRTPDASPFQAQKATELEISWSERRISSPLADDDYAEDKWKRPREKKRLRKRDNVSMESAAGKSSSARDRESSLEESQTCTGVPAESGRERGKHSASENTEAVGASGDTSHRDAEHADRIGMEVGSENDTNAMKIKLQGRYDGTDNARKSSGFSPQKEYEEMDTEQRGEEEERERETKDAKQDGTENDPGMKKADYSEERKVKTAGGSDGSGKIAPASDDGLNSEKKEDNVGKMEAGTEGTSDRVKMSSTNMGTHQHDNQDSSVAFHDGDDDDDDNNHDDEDSSSNNINQSGNGDFDDNDADDVDDDEEENLGSLEGVNEDKYHKLLTTITEFLTDYFNNLRETIMLDDGTPCITDVMVYLNTQCRSPEIRAIVKCVGSDTDLTRPLGRLLHMCHHFKAKHLKRVLMEYVNRKS